MESDIYYIKMFLIVKRIEITVKLEVTSNYWKHLCKKKKKKKKTHNKKTLVLCGFW